MDRDFSALAGKFPGQIIGVTGSIPFEEEQIRTVALFAGGYIGSKDIWQHEQIIVIGEENFDEEYLIKSIKIGLRFGFLCEYLSQQAFLNLFFNDIGTVYYRGDPRIKSHMGLTFLQSIGFEWPSTDAAPGNGNTDLDTGWKNVSDLAKYGYSVREGVPVRERREALKRAVSPGGLKLHAVVDFIAFLVRMRKMQRSNQYIGAIERWEDDLDWLYETYYKKTLYSFVWPSY